MGKVARCIALGTVAAGLAVAAPAASASTHPVPSHKHGVRCHKHSQKLRGRHVHCFKVKAKHRHTLKDHRTRARYARIHARRVARARARAMAHSFAYGTYAVPAYVVRCESGFNPRAVNWSNPTRPAGLYQIITSTWLGYGGGAYAPTADRASVYQQGVIASRVLRGQGPRAWECW